MTLTSTTIKHRYAGTGAQTTFPVDFIFWDDSDLELILRADSTGVETVWTEGTQYDVTGGESSTGNIVVKTTPTDYTPPAGTTLIVKSALPSIQGTPIPPGGPLASKAIEQQLDKIVRLMQQREEDLSRALKLTESTSYSALAVPDPESGKLMRWKADLTGLENATLAELSTGGTVMTPVGVADGGTGSTTVAAAQAALDIAALSEDNTLTGANTFSGVNTFSAQVRWSKGADVASGAALALGTDGNYFDITGTTTITSIDTLEVGTPVRLHFDAALTLTHHSSDLVLPGGANITTAAGDEAEFVEYASGDWRCVNYQRAAELPGRTGQPVQTVNMQTGAAATGTTVVPVDDTIPQNNEGIEVMTLAITPKSATSSLIIDVVANLASSAAGGAIVTALFQDSTAGALAAVVEQNAGANFRHTTRLRHSMTAGTTSATTFKVRVGNSSAGTTTFNGQGGGREMGGVMASSITITEISA